MLNPQNKLYRWGPISACPLFMYFAIEPAFAPLKKIVGMTYTESVIIFKDGKVTWLLDDKELGKQSNTFVTNVILNAKRRREFYALWEKRTELLLTSFALVDHKNLRSLSNSEILKLYGKFYTSYFDWFVITISIELAASALEPLLGSRLKYYLSKSTEEEFQQAFSTLTAPRKLTFYRKEQRDLLRILALPKSKRLSALAAHQKSYYWIYNSYAEAKILSKNYFTRELEKFEKKGFRSALKEIDEYTSRVTSEKKEIIKRIQPSEKDRIIIDQVQQLSELLDERKQYNFRAEHYLELFVHEFARRTNRKIEDLKYLLPEELKGIFEDVDVASIRARKKCLVFFATDKRVEEFVGESALSIARPFFSISNVNESMIHGKVASVGESYYFRGTARIVLSIEEIDKVKEGDILVTTMTSPDFVIGMKRAGAIITDTGSMLSHAAIVARELKKPCIVGTEIATKVIHDGDVVELHCGKGTVKVIKHA
ncbi:MAG TPA: PEP-utilizing enzyme [Patescibacteria group bacterium]|nr:PEP-utilizing enzyme [Patescibacteria group bacterium]